MRVGDRSASAPGRGGRRRRGINTQAVRYDMSTRGGGGLIDRRCKVAC